MHASDPSKETRAADWLQDRRRAGLEALLVGGLVAGVVLAAVAGVWGYARQSLETNYRTRLTALAQAAALQVDAQMHRQIREHGGDSRHEFRQAVVPLRRLRSGVPGIRSIRTLALDGGKVRVVLDLADDDDAHTTAAESGFADTSDAHAQAALEALGWRGATPRAGATGEPYQDRRGAFMTGYAPIFDASGKVEGAVAIDFVADDYLAHFATGRERMLRGLLPSGLLVLLLTYAAFRLRWHSLAVAREAARGESVARQAARQDKLTGLANRTAFVEQLQQVVRDARTGHGAPFAVMFLDFDHFKYVNDTLGHDAGDELLRQIGDRLRNSLAGLGGRGRGQRAHVAARFGGDEFVILLHDVAGEGELRHAADQLIADLAPTYSLRGVDVRSTASIGIVYSAAGADDAEAMLTNSDVAMYEAKRSGRGCYVVFDEAMRTRITRELQLERSLLKAIDTTEIRLAYQPVVELETGRMIAVEALLRWHHPTLGEVAPSDFLPLAEDTGLIVPLGEWLMQEACRQLAEWQRIDPARAPQIVSVNVSRGELALGPRLVERVRAALARAGLAPYCLQIEVPECDMIRDRAATTALLEQLRAVGVRLAMDEFGTGPASLSALSAYAFDSVKVAHSFVHGLATNSDAMALAHATLTLVENLGMASVAQGVEDTAQLAILQSFGCRYAQGRLLGSPLDAAHVLEAAGSIALARLERADEPYASASAA